MYLPQTFIEFEFFKKFMTYIFGSILSLWKLCDFLQCVQRSVYARWMSAKRSFFGTLSCVTAYHVDLILSETQILCKLDHTPSHGKLGCLRMICMSVVSLPALAIFSALRRFFSWTILCLCVVRRGYVNHIYCVVTYICQISWDLFTMRLVRQGVGQFPFEYQRRRYRSVST